MNMLKRMGSSGRMLGPKSPGSGKVVEVEGDSSATVASTKSAPPAQHAEDAGQSAFLWALDDVAMLRPLTEEACVQLIQERYQSAPKDKQYDKIHTRAGSVVVAINPLTYDVKEVIYTAAMRQKYHAAASRDPNVEDARYERPPVRQTANAPPVAQILRPPSLLPANRCWSPSAVRTASHLRGGGQSLRWHWA